MTTIQKLQGNEYLRTYGSMNVVEREAFCRRVDKWLKQSGALIARAQESQALYMNVQTVAQGWNDEEVAAFREGALLMTAMIKENEVAGKWLPDGIWNKSASRAIRAIIEVMQAVGNIPAEKPTGTLTSKDQAEKPAGTLTSEKPADTLPAAQSGLPARDVPSGEPTGTLHGGSPARPKHIDQYIHLLPEATQKRAATVKELHSQLAEAHDTLDQLIDDPNAATADLAFWQKRCTSTEDAIMRIYAELDEEWEKVVKSGRVIVDEFGVARKTPSGEPTDTLPTAPSDLPAMDSEKPKRHRATKAEMKERRKKEREEMLMKMSEEEKAKRREYLKKWLRDTRTSKSTKHDEQWLDNLHELVLLGGEVTESFKKAAAHYELEIPEEWINDK